jgi:Encapsulating protein for peroxidase
MTQNNPQVPWTDDQWARVNQVIQEEATSARVAAKFLPLYGPLPPDADFVRNQGIRYLARTDPPPNQRTVIDDKITIQLATLQVKVNVRGAQMADPEMTSVLALFRRAANVLARLEDVVVFRGLEENPAGGVTPIGGADPDRLPPIWEITGGDPSRGLWESPLAVPVLPNQWIPVGLARSCSWPRRPLNQIRWCCRRTVLFRSSAAVRCSAHRRSPTMTGAAA